MLNRIIHFSLHNKMLIIIISVLLLAVGIYVTTKTEVDVFPDLNAPTVTIMTEAPGLAPEEVEKLVSYPIESALNGATGVRRVRSSSDTGFSVVTVEFDWGTDIYIARQIVSEKLTTVMESLPPNVNKPVLGPQTSIMGEVMIIGLTSTKTSMQDLRTIADRLISPQLLSISGVAQVTVMGGDIKEYQIVLSPEKMKYYNVSLSEVMQATDGINTNTNGGIMYENGNEYVLKGNINTTDVDKIGQAVIVNKPDTLVHLSDIADVRIGAKTPILGVASEKGKPAVLVTVSKQYNTGTIELIDKIEDELAELQKNIPSDIHISTDIFRQSDFIESSIDNTQSALLEGALFVVIVLFFFLMDIRATIISLVALPLSVLITMIALHAMGYTINTMSLGGIAIAIGSLVDDAIVDVENVYKKLRYNASLPVGERKKILDVIFNASTEVRMPIFNSSLIIIASFLPLFFLSGMEGRLLIPLGVAFIISLIASTIVALTLTPVLCSVLLKNDKHIEKQTKEAWTSVKLRNVYNKVLVWTLSHKKVVLGSTGALFIVAVCLSFTFGRSFLPSFNEGSFTINIATLPGISLEESDNIGKKVDRILLSIPEIKTIARKTGRAELDEHSRGSNASEIEAPYRIVDRPRSEIMHEIRDKLSSIPGVSIEIGQPISHRIDAMLSGTEAQIAIKVFGDNLNQLYTVGKQIKQEISEVPGIVDINIEQQVERPEVIITPRRELLAKYGITIPEFSSLVNIAASGIVVSQVYEDGLPYDLTLRFTSENSLTMEEIGNLMIDSNVGKIPLSDVADIKSLSGPSSINRENARRRIVVSANVADRDLRGAVNDIQDKIESTVKLPEGYQVSYGGQFESEAEASRTLSIASCLAILCIFMLLYQEFKNFTQASIILVNIPLAMIGGVVIIFFTSGELNIPAIIGFISLLGISTRNGMLLMSHYNQLEKDGLPLMQRVYKGSADRLLPIVMTALSSALALIPIVARGGEPGNEIQAPLAIVILGGLFSSTILNLLVVPVIYYLYNLKKSKI